MPPGDGVTQLFDRLSSVYDAPAVQSLVYKPPQDEIVRELRRSGSRLIADVGCGTGILATRIRSELPVDGVYGCDASAGMLAQARARTTNVTWLQCRSERLPFRDSSLDAVVSSHAFHFFEQAAALEEFRRVLRPGGRVLVVILNPLTRVGSALTSMALAGSANFRDARSMRALMRDAGFENVTQRRIRRAAGLLSPDALTAGTKPAS